MLHHISFSVSDLERSALFYDVVLGALGYKRVWSFPDAVGYGMTGSDDKFAIKKRGFEKVASPSPGFHLAFVANSRRDVDAFHLAALKNGGKDNGAPGLRDKYGPGYYAAFVIDPDGYPIEAVIIDETVKRI
jgi:catechol 2,3-dioxygenase-like lactoylglutathione lyase family enzyme